LVFLFAASGYPECRPDLSNKRPGLAIMTDASDRRSAPCRGDAKSVWLDRDQAGWLVFCPAGMSVAASRISHAGPASATTFGKNFLTVGQPFLNCGSAVRQGAESASRITYVAFLPLRDSVVGPSQAT
jgi:hypothetical protein